MTKILAFGTGVLLRGLVADLAERAEMQITMVSQTPSGDARARELSARDGQFPLQTRGLSSDGRPIDTSRTVSSIGRALSATTQWDKVLETATDPEVELIVSNVSEAGFVLSEPRETSFPGRLGAWLQTRWLAGLPGVTVLPCELIEGNGAKLRAMLQEAMPDSEFQHWLDTECMFCETLVDRICTQGTGSLSAIVEPYCFWAIGGESRGALGKLADSSGGGILLTDDLPRYMLRKVRILNGLHTAMASIAPEFKVETVRDALEHTELGPFLEKLLHEEILPSICPPLDWSDAEDFAKITLSRMRNPFLEHQLAAISVGAETKWQTRLLPTMAEFEKRFGKPPEKLTRCRAAFLMG